MIDGRYEVGLRLRTDEGRRASTALFYVNPGCRESVGAYCIEYEVNINPHSLAAAAATLTPWRDFLGKNLFASNPTVAGVPTRELVSWIALNSYPAVSLDILAARVGIHEISAPEAIAATQAAVWALTDRFEYLGLDDDSDSARNQRVDALYRFLVGPANFGLPERDLPCDQIILSGPHGIATGDLIGPFTVDSCAQEVSLEVTIRDAKFTDKTGREINNQDVPGAADFYVRLPQGLTGRVYGTVLANAVVPSLGGGITHAPKFERSRVTHEQTLMISEPSHITAYERLSFFANIQEGSDGAKHQRDRQEHSR